MIKSRRRDLGGEDAAQEPPGRPGGEEGAAEEGRPGAAPRGEAAPGPAAGAVIHEAPLEVVKGKSAPRRHSAVDRAPPLLDRSANCPFFGPREGAAAAVSAGPRPLGLVPGRCHQRPFR